METEEKNTARSNRRVDKLVRSIRQKVANNDLRFRAHNRVNHMDMEELAEFMDKQVVRKLNTLAFISAGNIKKTEEFIVGQNFQHRQKDTTGIQTYISGGFANIILNPMRDRKVKLPRNIKLDKLRLLVDCHDSEMQAEVGHKPFKVAMFLPMLWSMLFEQKNGEEGFLLINGYVNIFHVELEDRSVVAVSAIWDNDEWHLNACDFDYRYRWDVFRNCLFVPAIM